MQISNPVFQADWPAPRAVQTAITRRTGGVSAAPYDTLNLAFHVGDRAEDVRENRRRVVEWAGVESVQWLEQVHGVDLVAASEGVAEPRRADGCYTRQAHLACAVLTADCLPVLICDRSAKQVAAVHAGWRGLVAGILSSAVAAFTAPTEELLVYLGPGISAAHYEVDEPLIAAIRRATDLADDTEAWHRTITPVASRPGHYALDLYQLARYQLNRLGVQAVYGGNHCTYQQKDEFFSFRRDHVTGRFASLIWLDPSF